MSSSGGGERGFSQSVSFEQRSTLMLMVKKKKDRGGQSSAGKDDVTLRCTFQDSVPPF